MISSIARFLARPTSAARLAPLDTAADLEALRHPAHTIVRIEPVRPGSPEDLFNRADDGCEVCGGMGRVSEVAGSGLRVWVECECLEAR